MNKLLGMVFFLSLTACGEKDKPGVDVDAMVVTPDAPVIVNKLGDTCTVPAMGQPNPCGDGHICLTLPGRSATAGYCSPLCNGDQMVCDTGYAGPAGGDPQCVLKVPNNAPAANTCAIKCDNATQCPNAMPCEQLQGAPAGFLACQNPL